MKLDYELTKKILQLLENECDGVQPIFVQPEKLQIDCTQAQINYHIKLLEDDDLVVTKPVASLLPVQRLTAEGHRVLEAMSNNKIWESTKGFMKDAGISALKEIPGIVVKLALSGGV